MPKTVSDLREGYPEIIAAIEQEARKTGYDEGYATGKEEGLTVGAVNEMERIKSIDALSLTGHEKLIGELKYDGKTTASEAAIKVLEAEKVLRQGKLQSFKADSPPVVVTVEAPPDKEEKKGFNTLVEEYQKEKGCSRSAAIKAVVAAHPDAHKEYLAGINTTRKED